MSNPFARIFDNSRSLARGGNARWRRGRALLPQHCALVRCRPAGTADLRGVRSRAAATADRVSDVCRCRCRAACALRDAALRIRRPLPPRSPCSRTHFRSTNCCRRSNTAARSRTPPISRPCWRRRSSCGPTSSLHCPLRRHASANAASTRRRRSPATSGAAYRRSAWQRPGAHARNADAGRAAVERAPPQRARRVRRAAGGRRSPDRDRRRRDDHRRHARSRRVGRTARRRAVRRCLGRRAYTSALTTP